MFVRSACRLPDDPRVLVVSARCIDHSAVSTYSYEFEDLICALTGADLLCVEPAPSSDKRITNSKGRIERLLKVGVHHRQSHLPISIKEQYDLLIVVVTSASRSGFLKAVKGLRSQCTNRACFIVEMWSDRIRKFPDLLYPLDVFQHVLVGCNHPIDLAQELGKSTYHYLPAGIDALQFCPWPDPPKRLIDVYQMGRRSAQTHAALLEYATNNSHFFYHYDSHTSATFEDHAGHRNGLRSLIQRSKCFITNPAKIDQPSLAGSTEEIGLRYFEGIAAGAVLVGEQPKGKVFREHFDWPDAVVPMPYGETAVATIVEDLLAAPGRLEKMSRQNVVQALRRHDHLWRLAHLFELLQMEPTSRMLERQSQLEQRACLVDQVNS